MKDMFSDRTADFKVMLENYNDPFPLHIGDVLHKAVITVDEAGTEAAAVTCMCHIPFCGFKLITM